MGASLIVDKTIKVVHVFQGLTTDENSGIAFDSAQSMTVATTPGSVVWVSPEGKRYDISVVAICPAKCASSKAALPRIVTHNADVVKTSFGKGVNAANKIMQAGRQGPSFIVMKGTSQAQLNKLAENVARKPMCNENGKEALQYDMPFHNPCVWNYDKVATAGPPSSGVTAAA